MTLLGRRDSQNKLDKMLNRQQSSPSHINDNSCINCILPLPVYEQCCLTTTTCLWSSLSRYTKANTDTKINQSINQSINHQHGSAHGRKLRPVDYTSRQEPGNDGAEKTFCTDSYKVSRYNNMLLNYRLVSTQKYSYKDYIRQTFNILS